MAVIDVDDGSSTDDRDLNDSPSQLNTEGPEDVNISDELDERETHDIKTLLCKYSDVLYCSTDWTHDGCRDKY